MAFGDPIDIDVTVSGENTSIVSFQGGETHVTQYSGGNSIISTLVGDTSTTAATTGYDVNVTMEGQLSTSIGDSSFTPFTCADLVDCTGSLVGKGETGHFVHTGETGNILGYTGNFVDKRETGNYVDKRETGNFITGADNVGIGSGIYSGKHDATLSFRSLSGTGSVFITGLEGNDNVILISGSNVGGGGAGVAISIKDEGAQLTSSVSEIDFTGDLVTATNVGNVVKVGIDSSSITGNFVYTTGDQVISGIKSFRHDSIFSGNILPQISGETKIGTEDLAFGSGYFKSIFVDEATVHVGKVTLSAIGGVLYANEARLITGSLTGVSGVKVYTSGNYQVASGDESHFALSADVQELEAVTGKFITGGQNHPEGVGWPIYSSTFDDPMHLLNPNVDVQPGTLIFNTIEGTGNVSISPSEPYALRPYNTLYISGSGANVGEGLGVFSGIEKEMQFKSLSGLGNVFLTDDTEHIYISGSGITGGANIGTGSGFFTGVTNNSLMFRSLISSGGILITGSGEHIIISGENTPKIYTGDFVNKGETGAFVDKRETGDFANKGETGNFVDKRTTGDFVNKSETGNFVDKRETGHFISGISVEDEGISVIKNSVRTLNFKGAGVTATSSSEWGIDVEIEAPKTFVSEGGGTGAGFIAKNSSSQNISNETYTPIEFDTEEFDLRNDYNPSTYRFYPSVSGRYLIQSQITAGSLTSDKRMWLILSGNHEGHLSPRISTAQTSEHAQGDSTAQVDISKIILTSATGEYYQIYGWHNNGGTTPVQAGGDFSANIFAEPSPISGVTDKGLGTGISSGITGGIIQLRTIQGAGNISITGKTNDYTIYISGETGNFVDKSQTGDFVNKGETGNFVDKREVGASVSVSNIGIGSGIYTGTENGEIKLRSISGISGVTVTGYGDDTIVISGTQCVFGEGMVHTTGSGICTIIETLYSGIIQGATTLGKGSSTQGGESKDPKKPTKASDPTMPSDPQCANKYDPMDEYTVLLVQSEAANDSTSFYDTGPKKHSVTAYGAKHKTSTFQFGTSSMFFDGSSDMLEIPKSSDFDMDGSTSTFTVEAWIKTSANQGEIIKAYHDGTPYQGWAFGMGYAGGGTTPVAGKLVVYLNSHPGGCEQYVYQNGGSAVNDNNWHHVAFVKDENKYTFYIDGTAYGNGTINCIPKDSDDPIFIGKGPDWNGYMEEVRLTKGLARYKSNFTKPTAPYYTATEVATFKKCASQGADPTAKNNGLLIKSETTHGNTTFTDSSPDKHVIQGLGGIVHSTDEAKFGKSSIYFDGTDNHLTVPWHEDFDATADVKDYTVEAWIKTSVKDGAIVSAYQPSSPYQGWTFAVGNQGTHPTNDGKLIFYSSDTSSYKYYLQEGGPRVDDDEWHHVAFSKKKDKYQFYIDGKPFGNGTIEYMSPSNTTIVVGGNNYSAGNSPGSPFNGYMEEIRIKVEKSEGGAAYQGQFAPPSSPFPTVTVPPLHSQEVKKLEFKSFVGSGNISITDDYEHIYISGSGLVTGAENIGIGSGIFNGTDNTDPNLHNLKLRSISGISGITVTGYGDDTIVISGVTGDFVDKKELVSSVNIANIGTGSGIYSGTLDNEIKLRSLVGSGNVFITGAPNDDENIYFDTYVTGTIHGGKTATPPVPKPNDPTPTGPGVSMFSGVTPSVEVGCPQLFDPHDEKVTLLIQSDFEGVGINDDLDTILLVQSSINNEGGETKLLIQSQEETCLLIQSETTNGSTSFSDSSPSNHNIALQGSVQHSTVQANFGNSSIKFDQGGAADYITLADHEDWNLGKSDFTLEAWVYLQDISNQAIINQSTPGGGSDSSFIVWVDANSKVGIYLSPVGLDGWPESNINTASLSQSTWYHLAAVRHGNSLTMYVDGVSTSTTTLPSDYTIKNSSRLLEIGAQDAVNGNHGNDLEGYLEEIRITKKAVYTSDFTKPSAPFSVNLTTFTDTTTNNTITRGGDTKHSSTVSKFGNTAVYFDGAGDYLSMPDNDAYFNFGSEDFTVEFWAYFTDISTGVWRVLVSQNQNVTNGRGPNVYWYSNTLHWGWGTGSAANATGEFQRNWTPTLNAWHHIAVTRNGNTHTMWIDGKQLGDTETITDTYHNASTPMFIGSDSVATNFFKGYLEEVRITKGLARYTKEFDVPTDPFLLDESAKFSDSSKKNHNVTTVGNTVHSTAEKKFGDTSIKFDGTDDYLSVGDHTDWNFGTKDFTMEAWVYLLDNSSHAIINQSVGGGGGDSSFVIYVDTLMKVGIYLVEEGSTSGWVSSSWNINDTPLNTSQWYHLAAERHGNKLRMYVDGESTSTITLEGGWTLKNSSRILEIGVQNLGADLNGYLDEIRISKIARYQKNFDIPTKPFTIEQQGGAGAKPFKPFEIKDSSDKGHVITRAGDTQHVIGNAKFGDTSIKFDGAGDYLTMVDDDSSWHFGNEDFTVEFWAYFEDVSIAIWRVLVSQNQNVTNGRGPNIYWFTNKLYWGWGTGSGAGDATAFSRDWTPTINTWYHVAATRKGDIHTLWIDGTQLGATQTISTTYHNASTPMFIGADSVGANFFKGRLEEIRITKGVARYETNFNVPEAPFAIGAAVGKYKKCVDGTYDENYDKTVLIILSNENNGSTTFTDSSPSKHVITSVGAIHDDEFKAVALANPTDPPFGKSVMKFDGTDDYLSIPYHEDFDIGLKDYTIEAWIKTSDSLGEIVSAFNKASPHRGWLFGIGYNNNDGKLVFKGYGNGIREIVVSDDRVDDGEWHHVAFAKDNYRYVFYIDGKPSGFGELKEFIIEPSEQPILIGMDNNYAPGRHFNGYIDSLRITKEKSQGGARYGGEFSPPLLFATKSSPKAGSVDPQYLVFKGLVGRGSVSISGDNEQVYISGSETTTTNIGYGSGIYTPEGHRSISGVSGIAVTGYEDNTIVISGSYTGIGGTYINHEGEGGGVGKTPTPGENIGHGHGIFGGVSPTAEEGGYDPLYDKCVLLINPDEADGSSTVEDLSKSKHSITVYGNTQHSNVDKKFGDTSLYFDGVGDYLEIADSDAFSFGTKDFAIEFWVSHYSLSLGWNPVYLSQWQSASTTSAFIFYYNAPSQKFEAGVQAGASNKQFVTSTTTPGIDRWYHIALVRFGGKLLLFVDGKREDENDIGTSFDINDSAYPIKIGAQNTLPINYFKGYIDGVRVTKEASSWGNRYVGEFTPPVAPFPSSKHPAYSNIETQKNLYKTISGVSGISVTGDDEHVYISGDTGNFVDKREAAASVSVANIGIGSGIYSGTLDDEIKLRSISGVSGVTVTGYEDNTIVISGDTGNFVDYRQTGDFVNKGETGNYVDKRETGNFITGADNVGIGSGIYSGKHDATLSFRSLSGTGSVFITGLEGNDNVILISGSNVGGGGGGSAVEIIDESTSLTTDVTKITFAGLGVSATEPNADEITVTIPGAGGGATWVLPPPINKNDAGTVGQVSFDNYYYYICIDTNEWRRVAISEW